MFRTGILWRFILVLVLLGVLAGGGLVLYRAGFDQGYQTAALTAGSSGSETAPQPPYGVYPPGYLWRGYGHFGFFHPFGWFFGIGFFLLVFFLFGGLFRLWGWRRWGSGPGHPGYWGYGPHPGWYGQQPPAPGEKPAEPGSPPAQKPE